MIDISNSVFQDIDPDDNILNMLYGGEGVESDRSMYYTIDKYNESFCDSSLFKIFHANIRSLNANGDSFFSFLGSLHDMPEIFCLSETWLSENTMGLYSCKGYSSFHTVGPGNGRGRGVSVFVDDRMSAVRLPELSVSNDTIETCAVKVTYNTLNIIVICIYRPHSDSIPNFTSSLCEILSNSLLSQQKIFLLGDFNVNLLSDENNNILFKTELQSLAFASLISKPTRFPPDNSSSLPSLLDHIWTNSMFNCSSGIVLTDVSDHSPIFVNFKPACHLNEKIEIKFRYFSEENIDKFVAAISNIDWNDILVDDINVSMDKFDKVVNDIYCSNFPVKTKTISVKRLMKPWLTSGILHSIRKKSKYFKLLKLGIINESTYKCYKNRLTNVVRHAKENYYRHLFVNNKKNSKRIWSTFKDLLGKHRKRESLHRIVMGDNVLNSDVDISEAFNNFFSSVGYDLDQNLPLSTENHETFMPSRSSHTFFIKPTTPEEVSELILKLKRKRSDINVLPVSLLVQIRHLLCVPLSRLINLSFTSGVFPDCLKNAKIIPIHKSGPRDILKNFRPISILPTYSKLFEKSMSLRLVSFLDKFNIISPNQFGFQKGKTTTQAILNFISNIYESFNKRRFSIGIFLDFKSAFDTVNHNILISKLDRYGIRGIAGNWFSSYLANRMQRVCINSVFSSFKAVTTGVPQGSILGPLLFIIYINDLPSVSNKFHTTLFADDSSLILSHNNHENLILTANLELEKIYKWTLCNRLSLNLDKTVSMLFTYRRTDVSNSPILINNICVPSVSNHKFLGIILDPKLKFDAHVDLVISKASKSVGLFYKTQSYLSQDLLILLYNSLIYPYFLYANAIWGGTFPTHLEPILLLQKRLIRIITKESYLAHTPPLFHKTKILRISDVHKFVIAQMGFHSDLVSNHLPIHSYSTRNSHLLRPEFQRLKICQNSISYELPSLWNSLPNHLKQIDKFNRFKFELKEYLISSYISP